MSFQDFFGKRGDENKHMTPEEEALAQAVLMRRSGSGRAEETDPLLARRAPDGSVNVGQRPGFVDSVDDGRASVLDGAGNAHSEPAMGRREGEGGNISERDIDALRARLRVPGDSGDVDLDHPGAGLADIIAALRLAGKAGRR